MRQRGQILHLNKYLHPTHYINNMTFTIYNNKRFVLKEEHFSLGMLFLVFFCNGGIIVIVSAFVLFIIRNIIVLLVGWWRGLMLLRLWLVVLALLGREEEGEEDEKAIFRICSTEKRYYCWPLLQRQLDRFRSELQITKEMLFIQSFSL